MERKIKTYGDTYVDKSVKGMAGTLFEMTV